MSKRFDSPCSDGSHSDSGSLSLGIPEAKDVLYREKLPKFDTPLREDISRPSILDQMLYKNYFDSCDGKSSVSMSIYDEKIQPHSSFKKILESPYKIRGDELESVHGGDLKLEVTPLSPFQDKFKNIWRSCIDSDEKKPAHRLNAHPKGMPKVTIRRSP